MSGVALARFGVALGVLAGAVFPFLIRDPYYQQVVVDGFITAIAVYGLNIILGFAGQLSLGHAAFFGIGAYTVALITTRSSVPFWPALAAACAIAAGIGYLVATISLRTKGHYFAIFTAAIGVIINIVFTNYQPLTNGSIGIIGIPGPPAIGPVSFDSPTARFELIYAFLLLAVAIVWAIRNSLYGRTLLALAGNEDLARATGIDVTRAKRLAFVAATALAGLAGGLYAMYVGVLGPETTGLDVTFNMLLYAIVGGLGSIAGPLVGTLLLATLGQVLQSFEKYQGLVYGPLLVILIVYFPGGIAGGFARLRAAVARAGAR